LSPRELQGKFNAALEKIGGAADSTAPARHKPIYQRQSEMTEEQAIQQAANALSALWKLGTR